MQPQPLPLTLTLGQFKTTFRTRNAFGIYTQAVGQAPAAAALDDMYNEGLRSMAPGPTGCWSYGATPAPGVAPPPPPLRFRSDADLNTFLTALDLFVDAEIKKISGPQGRRNYITGLKGRANQGLLYIDLTNHTEPEANYYTAPGPPLGQPPLGQLFGVGHRPAPPPPIPPAQLNYDKGLAWLKHGVQGSTAAYTAQLAQLVKTDGSFPLGANDTILRNAWRALVGLSPPYRGWNNAASQQKYPSNIGGTKLLNEIMNDMATATAMPQQGNNRWYDLALYLYGAIMTSQGFTEGNKRASRLAYVLMLLSGAVPFRAMNGVMGGNLADMI